jgi:hypothetical protein
MSIVRHAELVMKQVVRHFAEGVCQVWPGVPPLCPRPGLCNVHTPLSVCTFIMLHNMVSMVPSPCALCSCIELAL